MERRITVYFVDNHKVTFNRDEVTFRTEDGNVFTLDANMAEEELFCALVNDGKALVNWSNVCYVKETAAQENPDFEDL